MNPIDWIILIGAVAIVVGSIAAWLHRKKTGKTGCGCGCSTCPHGSSCPSNNRLENKDEER